MTIQGEAIPGLSIPSGYPRRLVLPSLEGEDFESWIASPAVAAAVECGLTPSATKSAYQYGILIMGWVLSKSFAFDEHVTVPNRFHRPHSERSDSTNFLLSTFFPAHAPNASARGSERCVESMFAIARLTASVREIRSRLHHPSRPWICSGGKSMIVLMITSSYIKR